MDHPSCWRGYGDIAKSVFFAVVAGEVGRLDNTSPRRHIGAHISTGLAFANQQNMQSRADSRVNVSYIEIELIRQSNFAPYLD